MTKKNNDKPKIIPSDKELFDALEEALTGQSSSDKKPSKPDIEVVPTKKVVTDYPIQKSLQNMLYDPKEYAGLRKNPNIIEVNRFLQKIAANPEIDQKDLLRISVEMGINPRELIRKSLGSVLVDENNLSLDKPIDDLLNNIFEKNPVPGKRLVVNPNVDISKIDPKELEVIGRTLNLFKSKPNVLGHMQYRQNWFDKNAFRGKPDISAVRLLGTSDDQMLSQIVTAAHELEHAEDAVLGNIPENQNPIAFNEKHHGRKGIFELDELIKKVRGLSPDPEKIKQLVENSKKLGSSEVFKKIKSVAPFVAKGALATAGGALPFAAEAATEVLTAEGLGNVKDEDELIRERNIRGSNLPENVKEEMLKQEPIRINPISLLKNKMLRK